MLKHIHMLHRYIDTYTHAAQTYTHMLHRYILAQTTFLYEKIF